MRTHPRRFAEDGYTVVSGLIGQEELADLSRALEETVRRVNRDPEAYLTRYTVKSDDRLFENKALMDLVEEVMGGPLRFWAEHALWSPELVDYDLNWHRDFGDDDRHDPEGRSTHVYINICLADDECFHVIPGSNRRPLTEPELVQQRTMGFDPLPGEVVVRCRPGDVLLMNGHAFHRGACPVGVFRRTLHIALQPVDEPVGGHGSWKFMREEGFLDTMAPTVREMMRRAIEWEDANPLPLHESMRRMRISKRHQLHQARRPTAGSPADADV
ncbi:MAG: hypothetical protein AUG49_18315 [Catenulispora sp. 13_1_20CM_3_70_7]|nr:MAG: hypothetical protein AUG49_18315 [Catenulispora sp. 13_1_20CM_3_70_7]